MQLPSLLMLPMAWQVLPNCYLWVEKTTGMRYKVLKLPPSSTGISVSPTLLPLPDCSPHGMLCTAPCVGLAHLCPLVPVSWLWLVFSWDEGNAVSRKALRPCCLIIVQGMISIKTLSKLAQLRHEGVMLVRAILPFAHAECLHLIIFTMACCLSGITGADLLCQ